MKRAAHGPFDNCEIYTPRLQKRVLILFSTSQLPCFFHIYAYHAALEVSHTACEDEFRRDLNPSRTAVPFGEQITWNLSSLPPKRDCSLERVKLRAHG